MRARQDQRQDDGEPLSPPTPEEKTRETHGEQRTKHQAHAHQLVTVTTVHGAVHILDLSVAQFGIDASLRCLPELVDRSAGCALSPTLAARAAAGIAPTLFAPQASADVARVMSTCLVQRARKI